MSDRLFGVLDGGLVLAVVIGLAVRQLRSVNREIKRDKGKSDSPKGAGHSVGEHRLDDR